MRLVIKSAIYLLMIISTTDLLAQEGIVTIESDYSVEETANRLENILQENDITIFEIVDHQQGAIKVGMKLRPTILIVFGNPKLGTPIMQCSQTAAIDLPQKILIWERSNGSVHLSYNDPAFLKKRHQITGCDEMLNKISDALENIAGKATKG